MKGGSSMDDKALIDKILKGDHTAAEELINKYYKLIYFYIYKIIKDYHTAYDLTQDTFIKAVRNISKYRNDGKFNCWLLTIASNTCKDYFRKNLKISALPLENINDLNLCVDFEGEKILENQENKKILKKAIDELDSDMREVIILKYYHHLKIREICEITSSKESTVKSRLRRALQYLNQKLQEV